MTEFVAPYNGPAPVEPPSPALVEGDAVAAWVTDAMWTASAATPRSLQPNVGPSELGLLCSRQIAFRLAGAVPVNMGVDPLPSVAGTAMHAWMAQAFTAMRPPGRYLVEHPVEYRGIRGTLDLYDRRRRLVCDWKFPKLAKAKRLRSQGPPRHYRWQLQTYAAGLIAEGEYPERCAIVFIPIDGALSDAFAFAFGVDTSEADEAVDRLGTVNEQLLAAGHAPGQVPHQPSRLCPWCPYHRPKWTGDLNTACPGEEKL